MTAYQMEINNAAQYIKDNRPGIPFAEPIDVFQFSTILSIVHCKSKEEVAMDIINAQEGIKENA
jgi:hypothetical protein